MHIGFQYNFRKLVLSKHWFISLLHIRMIIPSKRRDLIPQKVASQMSTRVDQRQIMTGRKNGQEVKIDLKKQLTERNN